MKTVLEQIEQLKKDQESCMALLVDCLKVRETHPEMAPRLDTVIATVETVMSEKATELAKLEATVRPVLLEVQAA